VFKVDHISAMRHEKYSGNSVSMKVSYYCGLKMYTEYVPFENSNAFAQRHARKWWRTRMKPSWDQKNPPTTVTEALNRIEEINHPTHIRVWVNKTPYPEIMALCFDGTAFGMEEMSDRVPTIVTQNSDSRPTRPQRHGDMDIPF